MGERAFDVSVTQGSGNRARAWVQVLDTKDGSYTVRYRLYETYTDVTITIKYNEKHVAKSPYKLSGKAILDR